MAVFQEPTQWDHELGNNADVSTLPDDTSATTGVASLQKLFQIINQTPLEAGGVAPEREDINALFKILGDSVYYGMNGGLASYNPAYDYVVGRYVVYNDTLYKCIQANGASSTVVAPDSTSPNPEGSDYWTKLLTVSDLSNLANTDLSNLSASGQALFTNKADKDFSNVTAPVQAFKDQSIEWGQPDYSSGVSIALTVNTLTNYVPSVDGFIAYTLSGSTSSSDRTAKIIVNGTSVIRGSSISSSLWGTFSGIIPVKKGDTVQIYPAGNDSSYINPDLNNAVFFPCKGA